MSIIPGAVVNAKYDLSRGIIETKRMYPLAAGTNIAEEGSLLVQVAGTSSVEAAVSAGVADEVPLGMALLSFIKGSTFTKYQEGAVPAVAPLTFQLARNNLVDVGAGVAEAAVYDVTGAAYLTVIAPGVPAAGQVAIDTATGLMTFNVAEAGIDFWVRYRYNMTVVEKEDLIRSSHVNRGADEQFESTSVAVGRCRVYTTMYDAQGEWELLTQNGAGNSPCLGPNGLWSTIAIVAAATPFGRVISLPTVDDPYLGIEYDSHTP
jgi:hypothetical protein